MEENTEKTFTEAVQDKARKGKKGVVKLVFGRTAVILLLVVLQVAVLVLTSLFLFKTLIQQSSISYFVWFFSLFRGVPVVAQWKRVRLGTKRLRVRSQAQWVKDLVLL